MIKRWYTNLVIFIVSISIKHPVRMIIATIIITLPTLYFINKITIDTNLIKLLPKDNPTAVKTKELQDKVGDGGQFIVLLESNDHNKLVQAVEFTAQKLKALSEVRDVQYKYPVDFIKKYKYLLIPNDYLNELYDSLLQAEAKANPFSDNLIDDNQSNKPAKQTHGAVENKQDMQILLQQYLNLPEYHQSQDGTIMGILIPTKDGISSLGKIKALYEKIHTITDETSQKFGVWSGISGNHRNKLVDYDNITNDLNVATIFSFVCILLILINSFRSFWPIVVVIYPLVLGLLWSFAIVPITFGSLNLITSFLAIILYGLGIDFPIHLIKRFQIEAKKYSVRTAMIIAFQDTGLSVIVSALTTAAGFIIVIFSKFRGFFEYGILSSAAIIMILIAMYVALPPAIYLIWRHGGLKKLRMANKKVFLPNKAITFALLFLTVIGLIFTAKDLKFDYYLSNTDFNRSSYSELNKINEKKDKVYSASMSPAAIYAASNLEQLDSINSVLHTAKAVKGSLINRVRSIRDFAPNDKEFAERMQILNDMKDLVQGSWVDELKDTTLKALIKDFITWNIPNKAPTINELPPLIANNLMGNRNSGYYLSTVYPTEERKDGKVAIAFSKELNSLKIPNGVKGPVGETMIFADVLNVVLSEAWWIVLFGQLLVFLVVIVIQRNWLQSLVMFIPLVAGLCMTFGIFAIFGLKITFFNVVCIPALMGMGVDGGIHYVNRYIYRNRNLQVVQNELFEPLYSAFLTVVFGYGGMIFSSHSGLKSMGILSSLGMLLIMIGNLVLLPGLLRYFSRKHKNENYEEQKQ